MVTIVCRPLRVLSRFLRNLHPRSRAGHDRISAFSDGSLHFDKLRGTFDEARKVVADAVEAGQMTPDSAKYYYDLWEGDSDAQASLVATNSCGALLPWPLCGALVRTD